MLSGRANKKELDQGRSAMSFLIGALFGGMLGFSSGFFAGAAWTSHFMRVRIKNDVMRELLQPNSEVMSRLSAALKSQEKPTDRAMEPLAR
jgi:hypothetical protein